MSEHEVKCPHCGHRIRDLWDYHWGSSDEIETNCGECEGPIVITREIYATYEAHKPKAKT